MVKAKTGGGRVASLPIFKNLNNNKMKNKTFAPAQIIMRNNGNTYYSHASHIIGKKFCEKTMNEIKNYHDLRFYVLELTENELIIRAIQNSFKGALFYYNLGDNSKRIIAHFQDKLFSV